MNKPQFELISTAKMIDDQRPYLGFSKEELTLVRFNARNWYNSVMQNKDSAEILKMSAAFCVRDAEMELALRN